MDSVLAARLARQRQRQRYRQRATTTGIGPRFRRDGGERLAFCSNDYLGLAGDPRLAEALTEGARRFGTGGGASHLVCGHSEAHERLESRLAELTGCSRALLFSSGYQANLGVISTLLGRRDVALHDRLNHASLLDATRLAGARLERFAHRDADDCGQRLATLAANRRTLVVSDGVFSMDGDVADLDDLAVQCERHRAWLMVDDAHGLGVLGDEGGGTRQAQGIAPCRIAVTVGTLGKALGTQGAFVAGSETLIDALIQFSRPYIYTTSLSPALAWATLTSLDIVRGEPERRSHLASLIAKFRREAAGLRELDLHLMPSPTPIQPLVVGPSWGRAPGEGRASERGGNEAAALALAAALQDAGTWCSAIRPPTVPEGTSRLRFTLSAAHTHDDLDRLLSVLFDAARRLSSGGPSA
ncbi:8-amino-7-oxononanoate synthase [Salinicola corii]|uniref:8-amino-7-oxononanoate synthase n=1 Tax=Salinicola corii TaxID=2606937 RepID=A0A640W9M2_9GAMM|nr:8-amino-7-oxononanoate synthase [Salinicola corii]KAA0015794.1 8-amino-7-oxononanoate synthase [Salinicola corii]